MRKILTLIAGTMITGSLFAGGLVTNTNQSAAWVRMMARNASLEVDAAYYNPAGLMKLENGFHVSLSNQTIFQTRTITSTHPYLNNMVDGVRTYEGSVSAPIFPSVYAVYKMDKFAFSIGFMPIGGGGGATYEDGLPSFERSISNLVPSLAAQGAQGYNMDVFFEGSSTFLGYQGAVSYKINDIISVAVGARYVTAKNKYTGHLNDVQLNMGGSWIDASAVLSGIAAQLTGITTIPTQLAPAISGGYGGLTPAQLVGAGAMTAEARDQIYAGLAAIGVPSANIPLMTVNVISATVTGATPALNDKIAGIAANASLVADQAAEAEQSGSGIAPFFSVNISPTENLNIAIKYEMATKLELTNKTAQDFTVGYENKNGNVTAPTQSLIPDMSKPITMFKDGATVRNDMPAMLSIGAQLRLEKLNLAAGANYYFDKSADYGHSRDMTPSNSSDWPVHLTNEDIIAQNGLGIQAGAEYNVSDKIIVSAGYAWANKGVKSAYQSDLTFANATNTVGLGGAYTIKDKFKINIGGAYTMYQKDEKVVGQFLGKVPVTSWETYTKNTLMFGIGLDVAF
jgi:long-chain fatty acid transport protein